MEHEDRILQSLERLERRMSAVEEYLGIEPPPLLPEAQADDASREVSPVPDEAREEDLEFELGQSWFAKVGIVALALGIAFLLTLPFEDFPQIAVPLLGYILGGGLSLLSRVWKDSLTLLSNYMRGAAIALIYFSTLRLTYFSPDPPLPPDSVVSFIPLILAALLAYVVALRRGSVHLALLATALSYGTLIASPSLIILTPGVLVLAGLVSYLYVDRGWTRVQYAGMLLSFIAILHWAVGSPVARGAFSTVADPELILLLPLATVLIFAAGTARRRDRSESYTVGGAAILNAGGAYGLVVLLTLTAFDEHFVLWHVLSSLTFLGLATGFWTAEKSKYSTFLYAMLGYQALTIALLKAFDVPEVFVWLSVQSLVVVATAVWFRSRFIVVVNFFIYVVIFLGYLLVAEQESGFSFGFGIVALISARILNWQQENLELKTEVMRNAYLISAFVVIPYSLYHFIPADYVALSWVGVALLYYGLSTLISVQKYRWMGHATLMLTALYVLVIGIIQLDTTFRVISFLVLGMVLLGTSIFFTRKRLQKSGSGPTSGKTDGAEQQEGMSERP